LEQAVIATIELFNDLIVMRIPVLNQDLLIFIHTVPDTLPIRIISINPMRVAPCWEFPNGIVINTARVMTYVEAKYRSKIDAVNRDFITIVLVVKEQPDAVHCERGRQARQIFFHGLFPKLRV